MLFQRGDTLSYREKTFDLIDQPLEAYFTLIQSRPKFMRSSDESRGYVAHWMIEDGWLYLNGISALWEDATPVNLKHLFPVAGDIAQIDSMEIAMTNSAGQARSQRVRLD